LLRSEGLATSLHAYFQYPEPLVPSHERNQVGSSYFPVWLPVSTQPTTTSMTRYSEVLVQ
jgi:hypothetical protein